MLIVQRLLYCQSPKDVLIPSLSLKVRVKINHIRFVLASLNLLNKYLTLHRCCVVLSLDTKAHWHLLHLILLSQKLYTFLVKLTIF